MNGRAKRSNKDKHVDRINAKKDNKKTNRLPQQLIKPTHNDFNIDS
ncbi:MAG: hypothetical protein ACRC2R_25350 [Xenococcaceae cyanobacterium]